MSFFAPMQSVRAALLSRRIRRERCSVILMYHRVAPAGIDPWRLLVTPEHFAEHLEVLRRTTTPLPLRRLVAEYASGRLPERAVAVTFDDGYVDNLTVAMPLLAAADISATVYVATGNTGTAREFWWDALTRALLLPTVLPSELEAPPLPFRIDRSPPVSEPMIKGKARHMLMIPPAATAPAPIYLAYPPRISFGSMSRISFSLSVSAACGNALRSLRVYSWKLTSSQHWALDR